MAIPPRFLDELRARLALSDIIGRHIKVTRAGREFKACCPFHHEKTPSFTINDDKQFYHCFGCGAHGDVVGFVMRYSNLSFIEAIEQLAAQAGLSVPEQSPADIQKVKKQKSLYTLLNDAASWFEQQLSTPAGQEARRYIVGRGLSEEMLSAFRIGFAPPDGQALRKHLADSGYSDQDMREAGLIKYSERTQNPYGFFRERLMFPVCDKRGRVIAFGGRVLPEHLRIPDRSDFTPPKYINSPDTPLFDKGRVLFSHSHAQQAAIDGQPVLVVEGYMDAIACFQGGFRGAVAPLGTALTEDHVIALWRMIPGGEQGVKVPILCFDGDSAGRRAAQRACQRILPLLKPNHSVRIAFLPDGQDPDSLIQGQGAQAFQNIIDGAINLVEFLWQSHTEGQNFKTPESRAGLAMRLEQEALQIPDRNVQYYYKQLFREKQRSLFVADFGSRSFAGRDSKGFYKASEKNGWNSRKNPNMSLRAPAFSKVRLLEMAILASVLNHPELFEEVEEELGCLDFSEKSLDRLRQAVLSTLGQKPDMDRESLHNALIEQGFGQDMARILSESVYTHAGFARAGVEDLQAQEGCRQALSALMVVGQA